MAIYFFDKNQGLIKIVPDSATIEAYQKQELDEDSLLKDVLDVKVFGDEQLLDAEYMAVKSYEGNDQAFDMYRIVTDTTPDKTMSFTGMSLAPYELTGTIIQDMRPVNHSLEYTLNRVLNGTDWRLGYIDDGLKNVTTNFYYVSVKEALKELQSLVGCEFVFKVEISGQKITDKWVEVYREMGNRTKKRFNYGTNALTVVRETNKADIYTALIGRGKGEEVSSAEDNASGQAGYGRKITFDEIEWSTAKGDPLDKPRGQYYLELPQATLEYGVRNVDGTLSPRIGIVEFDDEEDPANLLRLTYEQLKVSARPKVLFKSTVANIGATGIGDTVTIHRHDLNMHYETRVRKVVRNKLNDNKTQIELGDAVVTPSTKRAKQNNATIKNLKQELGRARQEITETRLSADGKTNNHYGRAEPERKRTGDTWYRPHPSLAGEMQMLTWNGNAWELILDTSDTSKVERELEEVIKPQIENMTASITEADTKAASALEKVDVNTNLISEHKKMLTETDGLLGSMSQKINSVQNTADGNEALIAKIQETPAAYLADYQKLINRADLVERTLGTTDSEVGDSVSRMVQTSGIIQTEVAEMDLATNTELTSKISQLADNIDLKVSSDDLLSQINVQAGGVLITSGTNKLNITPETTYIEDATIKSAMIESIEADKITTGTLDAGKVRVINLDANNITGNKTSFVQSVWNSIDSSIRIDSGGLLSTASDDSQVYLQNGIVGTRNPDGATIGQIGYAYESASPWYSMQISYGSHFQIRMHRGAGKENKQAFYIIAGGTESYLNTDNIYLNPVDWATVQGRFRTQGETRIDAQLYVAERMTFSKYGGYIQSQKNSNMLIYASNNLVVFSKGSNALVIDGTHAVFKRQISDNSDARLKTNIIDMPIDSLEAIRNLEIKKFDYLDGRTDQYGIIAQQAQNYLPELIDVDSEGYLMVNKSAMPYVNMHAIQQLDSKVDVVDDEVAQLKAQVASLQDELALLKGDRG